MQLISVHIENFGKLKNKNFDLNQKIIEIKQDNSWGKTTLAKFISAMFYGLPDLKDKTLTNPRRLYDPWQGGNFGGSLIFELENKQYRVQRVFNKKPEVFELTDIATKKMVEKIGNKPVDGTNLGDVLFGIGRLSYERSAFIPQGEIITDKIETNINEKLRNLINATDENNNLNKANKILEDAVKKIEAPRGGGKLKDIDKQLQDIGNRIVECEVCGKNAEEKQRQLEQCNKSLQECAEEIRQIDNRITKANAVETLREQMESYRRLKNEIDKYQVQAEQLKKYASVDVDAIKKKVDRVRELETAVNEERWRMAGVKKQNGGILFVLLCIFTLGIALLFRKKRQVVSHIGELTSQFEKAKAEAVLCINGHSTVDLLASFFEVKQKHEQFNISNQNLISAKNNLNEFLVGKDEEKLKSDLPNDLSLSLLKEGKRKLEERKNELIEKAAQLKTDIEKNEISASDIEDRRYELAEVKEQKQNLTATLDIIKKAKKFLTEASEGLANEYISPLEEKCCDLVSLFDPEKAAIAFDCESNVFIAEEGKDRKLDYFSLGNKELISLCMRFALVEAIFKGKDRKPCIILDDPFVNLDDTKLITAKQLIKQLANEYQIIYMTCHDSRKVG